MKILAVCSIISGLLVGLLLASPAKPQAQSEETPVEASQKSIAADAAKNGQDSQVQALARAFGVAPSLIQDLRAKKQGWGEISIQLAMAQRLSQVDPARYPTITEALAKIEALQSEKRGWGSVAKDLGLKLGPIMRVAEHARHDLVERPDKIEKADRAERAERLERPLRPERPERPERPRAR